MLAKKILIVFVLMFLLSFNFAWKPIDDTDLECYWNMDNSSTTQTDSSGGCGNISVTTHSLIPAINNYFINNSNKIYSSISNPINNTNDKTIMAWVKDFDNNVYFVQFQSNGRTWKLGANIISINKQCGGGTESTIPDITDNNWHLIAGVYDASKLTFYLYVDGVLKTSVADNGAGCGTTVCAIIGHGYVNSSCGISNADYSGNIDELRVFSRVVTSTELLNEFYSYERGVYADFDYSVTEAQVDLNDTSIVIGYAVIDSWEWLIDDVSVSTDQNYSFTGTEAIDYNVCLIVQDTTLSLTDSKCQTVSIGDLTPPTTTFSSSQIIGTTDQNITLTCTDNNSGCQYINFSINNGDWNYYLVGDNPLTIIYSGSGDHNIQYFSTDNSDNNESINTSYFTTYGNARFTFYDEDTEALLNDVTYTISPAINGETGGTLTDTNTLYLNLQGITSGTYTFTFSKENYGTRTYVRSLTEFSEIDINFMMLPTTSGRNIEFQVYQADETTLYTNTYIELLKNDFGNATTQRKQTDSSGKITFFLNPNDSAYTMRIYGTTTIDYNAMTLTVNKPKDESTAIAIDGNWELNVGGLAWQDYTDISGDQNVMIYANTIGDYELEVSDINANYYSRKYYVNYVGGTTAEELQPYLVPIADAVSTTIYTISGYTQAPVPSTTIKIYKTLPTDGRVIVEQVTTDAKGESLVSLIANDIYEFEIFDGVTQLGSEFYSVTSTSTTIYITIDDVGIVKPILEAGFVRVTFSPQRGRLIGSDTTLTQTITIQDTNLGITFTSARIYVTNTDINGIKNNDANIYDETITSLTNSIPINSTLQTLNGIAYDTNGFLYIYVEVTTNQGTYYAKYVYKPVTGFDVYKAIGFDLRPNFGCPTTNDPLIPCGPMLFIALLVSLLITIAFAMETGFTGQEGMAGLFLVIMGVFTYLAWVPIGIMALIVVSVIMLMIAIGGRNRL